MRCNHQWKVVSLEKTGVPKPTWWVVFGCIKCCKAKAVEVEKPQPQTIQQSPFSPEDLAKLNKLIGRKK